LSYSLPSLIPQLCGHAAILSWVSEALPVSGCGRLRRIERREPSVLDITGGRGSRFFLFTDQETLRAAGGNLLKAAWINGKREVSALGGDELSFI